MPIHLLATKFNFPPVCANLVPRPRLVERLNTGLKGQLTLISAPAGSGKTSLMSEWHATHGNKLKSAWISLDEADNDPVRFQLYLSTALATFQLGRFDSTFALLQSSQPVPLETIILSIIQELESFSNDCVLVLDDWHVIISPAIIKALNFFLDHLPPKLHLVLLTREDPPLPLARLRARNQLTEVRMADLRFTPDEASAFLNKTMGLNLSIEEIFSIEDRTEGWVAGLQLAALSMQGREDAHSLIEEITGSHHYYVDYLVE